MTATKTNKRKDGNEFLVRCTGVVTLLIKLGGLALAGHEALFVDPPRDSVVFAVSAFMMAGATGIENIVNNFLSGGKK